MSKSIFTVLCFGLMTTGVASAQDATNGIVICYANPGDTFAGGQVSGQRDAYDQVTGLFTERGLATAFNGIPGVEQRYLMTFRSSGGYIFYDRDVALSGQFEVGTTGQIRLEWLGEAAAGCDFLAPASVCPYAPDETLTVSCSHADAVPPAAQTMAPQTK